MPKLLTQPKIFAGVDAFIFDARRFFVSREDVKDICAFFRIGNLAQFEIEKDTVVSHSNFIVSVTTNVGQFILKFYPANCIAPIALEYKMNRFLLQHNIPTALMHSGVNRRAYVKCRNYLATCFTYIPSNPCWESIAHKHMIRQINTMLLRIKETLCKAPSPIVQQKHSLFIVSAKVLAQESKRLKSYDHKTIIDKALHSACCTYLDHQSIFIRRSMHNNANLTNFIVADKQVYVVDLAHIKDDYILSDLASMIISCICFKIPARIQKTIIQDYFLVHGLGRQYHTVLNTLIKLGLIQEYLKTVRREHALEIAENARPKEKQYLFYLNDRKKTIIARL